MKKFSVILSAVLAVCLLFSFTACDLFGNSNASDGSEEETQQQLTLTEQLYAEAVSYGYVGTLEEFLASLQGASAYDIAVRNGFTGTEAEWLASLKGEKGEKGDTGADGRDGEQVVAETVKGDSAYEIAVKNGFTGTETEWLASLKGADGEDGKDGKDGTNGKDGQDATITVYDVYEEAVAQGYVGTFTAFLNEYLTLTQEGTVNSDNLLSSVSVICAFSVTQYTFSRYGMVPQTYTAASAGSGVIYSVNKSAGEAYIITNYHVVYNSSATGGVSDHICVYLYGSEIVGNEFYNDEYYGENALSERGMGIEATYVGGSMYYDLAVLKITDERLKGDDVKAVSFADSNDISVSEVAYAIGNAQGEGISVTKGVVSVDSENITMVASDGKSYTSFRVMRIDTAVNSGNSGGGLFDSDGKLIGIVNAKTTEEGVENISYALPSNVVKYIVENILYYKDSADKTSDVRKCMLGITVSTKESSAKLDESGVVRIVEKVTVAEVTAGGLADGKLQADDLLVSATVERAGEEAKVYLVSRSFIIVDLMLTMRVGDTLTLAYVRDNVESTVSFVMTEECISEIG